MYAIFDIETTGGQYNQEKIIDIAIYRFDGKNIVDYVECLVNPEKKVPPFVSQMTKITNKMLVTAPRFYEVAKRILEVINDCILVAHDTSVDVRILQNEFRWLGYELSCKSICTIKLSQYLFPDMPAYGLKKICKSLQIPLVNRHRAAGDATATLDLFKRLLDKDPAREILPILIKQTKHTRTKIKDWIDQAPIKKGYFCLYDDEKKMIYVGWGAIIKKTFQSLIMKENTRSKKLQRQTETVVFFETGTVLFAKLITENLKAHHSPKYNNTPLKKYDKVVFESPYMLLIFEGRKIFEKGVLYIENGKLIGFLYTDLQTQIKKIPQKKEWLTPVFDSMKNRLAVYKAIENKKYLIKKTLAL